MFAPERAELKFLRRAPRRDMFMSPAVDQCEAASQRRRQTALVVTIDREPAASFRPVRCERGDDGVAALGQSAPKTSDVSDLIGPGREEVKAGPVVPDVVGSRRVPGDHVRRDPCDRAGLIAHARPGARQRRGGDVEHRDILIAARDQAVGKPRGSACDVDDPGTTGACGQTRSVQARAPGFLRTSSTVHRLCWVDAFPVAATASFFHRLSFRERRARMTTM